MSKIDYGRMSHDLDHAMALIEDESVSGMSRHMREAHDILWDVKVELERLAKESGPHGQSEHYNG